MFWAIVGIAVLVLIVLAVLLMYNSLVTRKNQVQNAWHQIDVQLKKRANLIPNLVETVKGYMKYERGVLESVTKARTAFLNAKTIKEKADATNMLTGALKSLFAVAENYPDLKASQNFLQLQEELSGIESKIAYARQFYNDAVMQYNIALQSFPTNVVAKLFGFKPEFEYFEIEEAERAVPKVSFE
jgi:LemA protein